MVRRACRRRKGDRVVPKRALGAVGRAHLDAARRVVTMPIRPASTAIMARRSRKRRFENGAELRTATTDAAAFAFSMAVQYPPGVGVAGPPPPSITRRTTAVKRVVFGSARMSILPARRSSRWGGAVEDAVAYRCRAPQLAISAVRAVGSHA